MTEGAMTTKIKIRIGAIEIEYEGPEAFLKEELPALVTALATLHKTAVKDKLEQEEEHEETKDKKKGNVVQLSTNSIAAKLKVTSGSELVMAAAARLALGLGKATFSRKDITKEMKTATSYHKKTYLNNLTKSINGLVTGQKLLEQSQGIYALHAEERKRLEATLA